MKKSISIFFCLLLLVLFAGCFGLNSDLGMCRIKIDCEGNGTATVKSKIVPLGTIIQVTTIPDEGYYAYSVECGYYSYSNITRDKKDKNIYYVYAYTRDLNIKVNFSYKTNYSIINRKNSYGEITVNPTSAYEGQKVEVTVTPNYGYYLKSVTVEDSRDNPFPVMQDETDPLKYTFIMPERDVYINTVFDLFLSFTTTQEKIKEGDVVEFTVNNHSDFTSCDLYRSYSLNSSISSYKELLKAGVDLSGGIYSYTATESGYISLFAKAPDKEDTYFKLIEFTTEMTDLPGGWENTSCHISKIKEDVSRNDKIYKPVTLISNAKTYSYPQYEYYYASNPEKIIKDSVYVRNGTFDRDFEYSYEINDSIFFRFYDESHKVISRTIQIDIPTYPEEPKTLGKYKVYAYSQLGISTSVFKDVETTIEIEAGGEEYFSVSKDGDGLLITSKKTTGKEWEVNVKNSLDESLAKVMVRIPYSGTPVVRKTL